MAKPTVASLKAELDAALSRIDTLETDVLVLRAKVNGTASPEASEVVQLHGVVCGNCSSKGKVVKHSSVAMVKACYGVEVAS